MFFTPEQQAAHTELVTTLKISATMINDSVNRRAGVRDHNGMLAVDDVGVSVIYGDDTLATKMSHDEFKLLIKDGDPTLAFIFLRTIMRTTVHVGMRSYQLGVESQQARLRDLLGSSAP